MTETALRRELGDERVPRLLFALLSEGLVQRRSGRVSLPI
jgi:hypothetical protein